MEGHHRGNVNQLPNMGAVGVNKYSTQILSVFIMCLALIIRTSKATLRGNETDHLALMAFRAKIFYDPQGAFRSWNTSTHFCNWEGIICGQRHRRVTTLNLTTRGLVGHLSPDIGNLSFLREIILYNNNLGGVIPKEVDRLFRLKVLSLGRNALEGNLPETLGRLNRLVLLELSSNKLSGMIPISIFNLSSLSVLSFANNQLDGSLPSDFGLAFPNLQKIQLSNNKFTGSIPISLSNASELQEIEMHVNNFSGYISVDFGRLRHLEKLNLANNNLKIGKASSFFELLINCSSLKILELGANNFEGSLPSSIGNLSTDLIWLSLADNHISGSIPSEICKFINLIFLSLEGNKFIGIIPSEIVKLGKLQRVVLSNNRLSGNIPASIGNLSLLDQIHLENNELNGTIPPSLGNCPMLVLLDLSQNKLSGTVPNKLFDVSPFSINLNLSRNHLVGSLPADIGVLRTLIKLDVSENEFSGLIPNALGGCVALESLYIQGNFIEGHIPQSLKTLKSLQNVDLSRNNLYGNIPDFSETLYLTYSNLSWNDLQGEVPMEGVFINASAFSVVGNKRLCGGIPELQLPRCNTHGSHKHKISRVHTFIQKKIFRVQVLILIGSMYLILTIGCISYLHLRRKKALMYPESDISPFKLSYKHIHQATNGFSLTNLISEDDIGLMYKGNLDVGYDGMIPDEHGEAVAVKVLKPQNEETDNIFITECEALRNIRHRNIVKIISTCSTMIGKNTFQAIIYEFMENGSLDRWLHSENTVGGLNIPETLNLSTRINIAIDVASALDYLHNQSETSLIHCNLKPSNILLDTNMTAHVANFRWAKSPSDFRSSSESSILGLPGTIGYVPPEYRFGRGLSTKGDVYSYGIIILEMLTGKKPTDPMFHDDFNLQNFARNALSDRVMEIIDPVNLQELIKDDAAQTADCLSVIFNIGVNCTLQLPQLRPDISDVLSVLETVRIIFKANKGDTQADINQPTKAAVLAAQRTMNFFLRAIKKDSKLRSLSMLPSFKVSYMDLHKATKGFSETNLVGAGGFGSVYKGTFELRVGLWYSEIEDGNGTAVAIKVFNLQRRGAARSFISECETLRNIHHRNLVKFIATCTSVDEEGKDFRAILYELMDHGSLEMWLHSKHKACHNEPIKPRILSLHDRINIAIDVACALSYLHHESENCIIHCDLKPNNILLDKNMVAHVADFGLAIFLAESPNLHQSNSSIALRGTTGYIAPEYGLGSMVTTKGDIYSFGILLLEMLTGKKPTHHMFHGGLNLHNFAWAAFPNHVMDITDPVMMKIASETKVDVNQMEEGLTRMFNIGLECSKPSQKDRPDMRAVLQELKSIRNIFQENQLCATPPSKD